MSRTADLLHRKLSTTKVPVLSLALVVTGCHILIALSHGGAVAVPDVPSYLHIAQRLWGAAEVPDLAFHPGYGYLLAPFGVVFSNNFHTVALCVNACLAGLLVALVYQFGVRLEIHKAGLLTLVFLAAASPVISSASRIAWPEQLLMVVILVIALLVDRNSSLTWLIAGLVAGLSFIIHPRMIVVSIGLLITAGLTQKLLPAVLGVIPALVFSSVGLVLTNTWPSARITAAKSIGEGPSIIDTFLGQILALSGSTLALGLIGFLVGLKSACLLWRSKHETPAIAFIAVTSLGMLALGAWALAGSDRSDTLMYGRYIDPWSVPLVAIGIRTAMNGGLTRRIRNTASVLTLISVASVLTSLNQVAVPGRTIMTQSLGLLWKTFEGNLGWVALVSALLTLSGLVLVKKKIQIVFIGILVLASLTSFYNQKHLSEVGEVAKGQTTLVEYLPQGISCLAHDTSSTKSYAIWLYRLEAPHLQHEPVSIAEGNRPCSNYLVAGTEALQNCAGAKMIVKEPRASWGLWTYPDSGCD